MRRVDILLDTKQLSQRLGIREGTLRVWRQRGQGPAWFKVGVAAAYRLEDVEAWEQAQQLTSEATA